MYKSRSTAHSWGGFRLRKKQEAATGLVTRREEAVLLDVCYQLMS
jgi:hypothetical protein